MAFEQINSFLDTIVFKNPIRDYAQSLITFLGLLVVLSVFKRIAIKQLKLLVKRTTNDFDDFVVSLLDHVGFAVFIVLALYFSTLPLVLSESIRIFIRYAMVIVVTFRAIMTFQEIIHYGISKAYRRRMKADDPSLELIVKSITGILRWAIWGFGLIFILDNLGVNVSTFVAGIGIGGIAVAMASQAILGDAFSALCIFLDKPFEIGDFVMLEGGFMGTVEHIGVKTTRIRSLSGEQLVFANSDLTKSRIKNYKRMQLRRAEFKIQVDYQTPVDKVKRVPSMIKEIISTLKDVNLERVHFSSLGDSALVFEIAYYVNSADFGLYMDRQQEINLAIMEKFALEGILFAFPTQQMYLRRDLPVTHGGEGCTESTKVNGKRLN